MKYILYDTKSHENYYPFSLNHSMFEARVGAFSFLERIQKKNSLSNSDVALVVRDDIKDFIAERYPDIIVNPTQINDEDKKIYFDEKLSEPYILDYLLKQNKMLMEDCSYFSMAIDCDYHKSAVFIGKNDIHVSSNARISGGVVLDATDGPIIIDDRVFVDIGALIKGPVYIGKNSIINPGAKLRGNISIGHFCKIGGEIEDSTFMSFSNKQHDGYLGHSYIGEWVNLGANTNNSDLKNNYSNVRFKIGSKEIDTNQMFVGCAVGDYTKTAISTMINTGTYIGMGANVFGTGFQSKFIPSFSWGRSDRTDLDKFLETLHIVKGRRDKKVSKSEVEIIKKLYNSNKINTI